MDDFFQGLLEIKDNNFSNDFKLMKAWLNYLGDLNVKIKSQIDIVNIVSAKMKTDPNTFTGTLAGNDYQIFSPWDS